MVLPKPWHLGQAPNGLLKEKRLGEGYGYSRLQSSHRKRLLDFSSLCSSGRRILNRPCPRRKAVSRASTRRSLISALTVARSPPPGPGPARRSNPDSSTISTTLLPSQSLRSPCSFSMAICFWLLSLVLVCRGKIGRE